MAWPELFVFMIGPTIIATTIVELLDAQITLTQAEADVVQADYAARQALAGLEVILGRRLFPNKDVL